MGTLAGPLVYSWEDLIAEPVEEDAALATWLSCWLELGPSTVNTLNRCFPHHLPPRGFLVKISGPHSTLQHPSSFPLAQTGFGVRLSRRRTGWFWMAVPSLSWLLSRPLPVLSPCQGVAEEPVPSLPPRRRK